MLSLEKILVPLDLDEHSVAALQYALSIAARSGGSVLLLHVVEDSFPYPEIFALGSPTKDYFREMRRLALESMDEMLRAEEAFGVKVERLVVRGRPATEIVRVAEQKGVDLIVMSSHGRTGVDHAIFGSQAERVLHRANCPVLVVPSKESRAGKARAVRNHSKRR